MWVSRSARHGLADCDGLPPLSNAEIERQERHAIRARRTLLEAGRQSRPQDQRQAPEYSPCALSTRPAVALSKTDASRTPKDLSALCLSGGGIRSAAFSLGIIQGLAKRGVLEKFDYLSTVSGGGYIGSFLTAWIQRVGYKTVIHQLKGDSGAAAEESPLTHLRRYSRYLTPHSGFISTDMLTVVAIYLRNLILNWLIILSYLVFALVLIKALTLGALLSQVHPLPFLTSVLAVSAVTLLGLSQFDSALQRPGWGVEQIQPRDSSGRSKSRRGLPWESRPVLLSGLALGVLALQRKEVSALEFAVIGALVSSVVLLMAYQFAGTLERGSSVRQTANEAIDDEKGLDSLKSWTSAKRLARFGLAYGVNGFIVGLCLAGAANLSASAAMAEPWHGVLVLALGPTAVAVSLFLGETFYTALAGSFPWSDAEREWLARAWSLHVRLAAQCAMVIGAPVLGSWAVFWLLGTAFFSPLGLGTATSVLGAAAAFLGQTKETAAKVKEGIRSLRELSLTMALSIISIFAIGMIIAMSSYCIDVIIAKINSGIPQLFVVDSANFEGAVYKISTNFNGVVHNIIIERSWPLGSLTNLNNFVILYYESLAYIGGLALAIGLSLSTFVDINDFSLHATYRNRLTRAFLGATNVKESSASPSGFEGARSANPLTDFDDRDDLFLTGLWPEKTLAACRIPPQFHVINATMNIVATKELAWQERKALPFVFTPLHAGSSQADEARGAYRGADVYGCGAPPSNVGRHMRLGSAMTISGAAASSEHGLSLFARSLAPHDAV